MTFMTQTAAPGARPLVLPHPVVEVAGVSKRFGRITALDQVDFSVRAGRVTAILGPNAAGKSTIIKSILGLVRPDAGSILVHGILVNSAPEHRNRIGYMPQAACFPANLTGRELIAMLRDLRDGARPDLDLVEELELGGALNRRVRTLSGGTRQKLSAVVAFLFKPSLLILDEPTAGLDPVASGVLKRKILRARDAGGSVILASHILAEVEELVDDIVFLVEGRLGFAGPLEELKNRTGQDRLESAVARLMMGRAS
jgi:Cu-processing system ATP-binding protein